nr:GDP-fucose protein O-fucosyltransferase [Tanacetum cinerariifolium]
MRKMGKLYVALHLRFEPDMLAFSGCYYGGGEKERKELGKIRKRWKTLHSNNPDKERRQGRCPLTPEEVELIRGFMGEPKEVRPGRGEFHENPATCISEDTEAKSRSETLPRKFGKANIDSDEVVADQDIDNEPEASDQDKDDDDLMGPQFLQSVNETNVDDDPSVSELPELEELLSD